MLVAYVPQLSDHKSQGAVGSFVCGILCPGRALQVLSFSIGSLKRVPRPPYPLWLEKSLVIFSPCSQFSVSGASCMIFSPCFSGIPKPGFLLASFWLPWFPTPLHSTQCPLGQVHCAVGAALRAAQRGGHAALRLGGAGLGLSAADGLREPSQSARGGDSILNWCVGSFFLFCCGKHL